MLTLYVVGWGLVVPCQLDFPTVDEFPALEAFNCLPSRKPNAVSEQVVPLQPPTAISPNGEWIDNAYSNRNVVKHLTIAAECFPWQLGNFRKFQTFGH